MHPRLVPLYSVWNGIRGERRFPAKSEMLPRAIKDLLRHVCIIRVIDGGRDFEFRVTGDAVFQQFGEYCDGRIASELGLDELIEFAHRPVVVTGKPALIAYRIAQGGRQVVYHEALYLPLGEDPEVVDHIIAMGVNFPWKLPR